MIGFLERLREIEEAVEFGEMTEADLKSHKLSHSKKLDVHTWSDHPEVNKFINPIYEKYFSGREVRSRRQHVKVLLLDLYVTWVQDSNLRITFSRNKSSYKAKSRYNELHISQTMIELVDKLVEAGLIEQHKGFYVPKKFFGRETRISATPKLIDLFKEAKFSIFDVGNHPNRLSVILRDKDADDEKAIDVEYEPNEQTTRMSALLASYNELLSKSYIDIPQLDNQGRLIGEEALPGEYTVRHIDKYVTRVFNRSSFECGGRFYGGWWQRCPRELRPYIFINEQPTNEIDFSGLHIVMLYAFEGINYWEEDGADPYEIELAEFEEAYEGHLRAITKSLMLVLLNAKKPKQAYSAFRQNADKGSPEKSFKDVFLKKVHKALEKRHPNICEFFGADIGIKLMRLDSDITEIILTQFIEWNVPVLCLHDSYIVPSGYEDELISIMHKAFENVMGVKLGNQEVKAIKEQADRIEDLEAMLNTWMPYEKNLDYQIIDEKNYLKRNNPIRSKRYKKEYNLFQEWLENKDKAKKQ